MATGRVYKRGNEWYIDIYTGRFVDGKRERVRRKTAVKLKSEAQEILNKELYRFDRLVNDNSAINNNCRIDFIADQWYKHNELHLPNPQSRNDYKTQTGAIISALYEAGAVTVEHLAISAIDDLVQKFLAAGTSHNTINKRIARFKGMLDYALDRKFIYSNPIAKYKYLPEKRVKIRRALTDIEAKELVKVSPFQYALVWKTFLCSGLRESELIHMPVVHINASEETMTVAPYKNFKPKTEAGVRTIPLHKSLLHDILKVRNGSEYVFLNEQGRPHRQDTILKAFKRCMSQYTNIFYVDLA